MEKKPTSLVRKQSRKKPPTRQEKAWRSRKEDASCFYWACSCELTPRATFHAGSSGRSPNIQSQIDSLAFLTQCTDPRPCVFAAAFWMLDSFLGCLAKRQTVAFSELRRANTHEMKCSGNLTMTQRKKHRRNTRDCLFFFFSLTIGIQLISNNRILVPPPQTTK